MVTITLRCAIIIARSKQQGQFSISQFWNQL